MCLHYWILNEINERNTTTTTIPIYQRQQLLKYSMLVLDKSHYTIRGFDKNVYICLLDVVFAWIIPILDVHNTRNKLSSSSSSKFHATSLFPLFTLLLCVNSLYSFFPSHIPSLAYGFIYIFRGKQNCWMNTKKNLEKLVTSISLSRRTKGVRCKNSYITTEWLSHWRPHTRTHT